MATADGGNSAVVEALALGQIEHASLLLSEGNPLDLQRAAEVVIDKGQYEALKFLISNYKLDVDKHFLLHRALITRQEDIAKLLIESGADVNNYTEITSGYFHLLPLQLSCYCSLDMTHFLLESGADINRNSHFKCTTLSYACGGDGDVNRVAFLLEKGANVQAKDCRGSTALHSAASAGQTEKLTLLIDHGADIEAKDIDGYTPLMLACSESKGVDCLKILLEKGADYRAMDMLRQTGLHMAARSGNSMALKLLIQYGAQLEARTYDGDTALMLACKYFAPAECVRMLLENGAFPIVIKQDGIIFSNIATKTRDEEQIQMLLQYGATEENRINQEETELMRACGKSGSVKAVLSLLQSNVSPNVKNHRGETANRGDIETLKLLVRYKADVNAMTDDGVTPLMLACAKTSGNEETVKFLLEHKALPNVTDVQGLTALQISMLSILSSLGIFTPFCHNLLRNLGDRRETTAVPGDDWRETFEIVKLLVKHGADLEDRTPDRRTPFLIAVETGNRQLIELLHDLGADIYAKDGRGLNAINKYLETIQNYDLNLLQYLIDKGVSVNCSDGDDSTPLMMAVDGNVELLKLLLKAGADVHAVITEETGREITALSMLLEYKWLLHPKCAEELIRHGAVNSLPERCNGSLHQMIQWDRREMIHLLLTNGIAPTMSDSIELLRFAPAGPVSPLTVVLDRGNIPVIQYLLGNLMLCPCDIYGYSYFSQWRHRLISENMADIVTLMDKFYSQPKSLFQLSFVTVSHALGGVPGRVDRVNSLPLPSKVKDKLLFKDIDVPMDRIHSFIQSSLP